MDNFQSLISDDKPNTKQHLFVVEESLADLQKAAKWAKIFAYVSLGTILLGLLLPLGFLIFFENIVQPNSPEYQTNTFISFSVIFIVFIILITSVAYLIYRPLLAFAEKAESATYSHSPEELELAFIGLTKFYKYFGIMTIVAICFIFLALVLVVFGVVLAINGFR